MKKVIISGATGQDGSLMADYLLEEINCVVYGVVRQLSVSNHKNIEHLKKNSKVKLIDGDITCPHSMSGIIKEIKPDYFINFAANSFVGTSWTNPTQVFCNNTLSVLHQLEAIRQFSPKTRYYQAGSSEMFGDIEYSPQDEKHPLNPQSPYGASKCSAHHLVRVYKESYNLYAVSGILFNHESERRGEMFITRKITKNVARIYKAIKLFNKGVEGISPRELTFESLKVGNIYSMRDWSYSPDFIDGIWRMLNQEDYNDDLRYSMDLCDIKWDFLVKNIQNYVLASGETHTIKEFIELAFKEVGIEGVWTGEGLNEKYVLPNYVLEENTNIKSSILVEIDKKYFREAEVNVLLGNSTKARDDLGWTPQVSFNELVKKMVDYDINNP